MSNLIVGVLGAVLATNQPAALSNLVLQTTGVAVNVSRAQDPVEKEYEALLAEDDRAQEEVDKWIRDNNEFAAKGGGLPRAEMNRRIRERFAPVKQAYEAFIKEHPAHSKVRIAYGSFLGDLNDEDGALQQYEKAVELDPKDPAGYNNAAHIYTHIGPVRKAFDFYSKAIEINPLEPLYYHNLGTTVYLFRKDAMEVYGIDEQQVFNKAFNLYSNAMRLDPGNFPLASDVAQTYYGVKPMRTEEALRAWTNAFSIANDDVEREGVHVHFARVKLAVGRFQEARAHLDVVTNAMYAELKKRLERRLREEENKVSPEPAAAPHQTKQE